MFHPYIIITFSFFQHKMANRSHFQCPKAFSVLFSGINHFLSYEDPFDEEYKFSAIATLLIRVPLYPVEKENV